MDSFNSPEPLQVENAAECRIYSPEEKAAFAEEIRWRICPFSQVSTARHSQTDELACFITGCQSWKCDVCGPKKKRKLVSKILKARPQRFLTLTVVAPSESNSVTWSPREAFDKTRRQCSELFKAMKRETGKPTEYCRVLEQTKAGYPHYHYLTRGPFWPVASITAHWRRLTGSYIVDIQRPQKTQQTIAYVAKYVSKSTAVDFTERRVSASRRFYIRCRQCDKVDCECRVSPWTAWKRGSEHWQAEVLKISRVNSFLPSATPGFWYIVPRSQGDDIPERIASQFHDYRVPADA